MGASAQPNGGGLPAQPQFQPVPPGQPAPAGTVPVPPGVTIVQQGAPLAYGLDQLPPAPQPQQPQLNTQPQQGQIQPQQIPLPNFQQAPQPGQQPQGQPAPVQVGGDTVLDGPDVPQELRGKPMKEVLAIYRGLSRLHAGGSPVPQPGPVPQPQPQQQPAPQAPAPQPIPTQGSQMTATDFFRNPAAAIQNAVRDVVQQQLAPIHQQAVIGQIQSARVAAAQQIGLENFQRLEPMMQELLQGVQPEALANPQVWMIAAQTAYGRLGLSQQIGQSTAGGAPQVSQPDVQTQRPNGSATPAGAYPAQYLGPNGQPLPNVNSFFSEPSGVAGGAIGATAQLNPTQREAARLMEMSDDQYLAWMGGVQRGPGR